MGLDAPSVEKPPRRVKEMKMQKIILWVLGLAICVLGISFVLIFWKDVVALFRGVVGGVLAIIGLVMMSMARD